MTNRTVVIRRQSFGRQQNTKRKTTPSAMPSTVAMPKLHEAGFINPVFVVIICTAFSALFYIYSVNQTAVKGIAIRTVENEIAKNQKENESLKIKEAELKSLYHIEESSKGLNMIDSADVKYLEESPTVALGSTLRDHKN